MAMPYSTFAAPAQGHGYEVATGHVQYGVGMDRAVVGAPFMPSKRRRLNVVAIGVNVVMPWVVFSLLYAAMSFSLHYHFPNLCWGMVYCGMALATISGWLAYRAKQKENDPMWFTISTVTLLAATALAAIFGDLNYWLNMKPYYDVSSLQTYTDVNPAQKKGQQLMDAGTVLFAKGSTLDLKKARTFKNNDVYCVAPITIGKDQLQSYDFWAVGVNCCKGGTNNFECGAYNNMNARGGLRLLRDDQRPFFRLAVEQAEAAYKIKSAHPLFFSWTEEPETDLATFSSAGMRYFVLGIFMHLAFNVMCVAGSVMAFAKILQA